MRYEKLLSVKRMPKPLCLHVIEVETEVVDKLKYIEETKETMDKNSNKLLEIKDNMKEIFAGKAQLYNYINNDSKHVCHEQHKHIITI